MAVFLSDEWLQDFNDALVGSGKPPVDEQIVIEQEITSNADTSRYCIVLDPAAASVTTETEGEPTVRFSQSRAVAEAIAQGRTSAHEAFMLGQLEVTGDTRALVGQAEVSAWLAAAMESLRSSTTW